MAGDQTEEVPGDELGDLARRFRQHDCELIAAQARKDVAGATPLPECRGDAAQQLIADGMAELVVDRLEAVQVHHQHRAALPQTGVPLELTIELLIEPAPIEQAGQQIMIDDVLQLALKPATLGDVLHLVDHRQRCLPVARGREPDSHRVAVGASQPELCHVLRELPGQQTPPALSIELSVLRFDQVVQPPADELQKPRQFKPHGPPPDPQTAKVEVAQNERVSGPIVRVQPPRRSAERRTFVQRSRMLGRRGVRSAPATGAAGPPAPTGRRASDAAARRAASPRPHPAGWPGSTSGDR